MDEKILPVSVCICTRNASQYLDICLKAVLINRPAEIIVIDGQSTDETVEIAESFGVKIIHCEAKGLAWQRQKGLEAVTQPYMAVVDAHHSLDPDCMEILLCEMKQWNWNAIQASLSTINTNTYWARAMNANQRSITRKADPSKMVGRPCIYETQAIRQIGFDPFFGLGIGCEDADVSIRFEKAGFTQGIGSGHSSHYSPETFQEWWGKWKKYGRGDAHLIVKYPEKKWQIRKHQFWIYPVIRSMQAIKNGNGIYVPFFVLFGWVRFAYSLAEKKHLRRANSIRPSIT